MRLHIIIAAWQKPLGTRLLLDSILLQTYKNWICYVIHDGPPADDYKAMQGDFHDPRVNFYNSEVRFGCYGHINRRMFLEGIRGDADDFVLITNCDNYYIPPFAEYMLREAKGDVGIVYCNTIHSHQDWNIQVSRLKLSDIDMGAFIVRLPVAQEVGFKHVTYPAADGLYAEECATNCMGKNLRTVHINKVMFIHN